jgi:serine/threonine protein kinase
VKKPTPFGKYYLLERINVGGMAEVFRAKAFGVEGFERLVAVKRILPNIAEDKEFIRMFIEEAKLAVQLNHANIAQIYDLGVNDGAYYIALEHVHGRDLRAMFDRCRQLGEPMPVSQACFCVMKVCEGLDYAHNKRDQAGRELHLVHRDVSPQNILISFEGEVKLIDFGIAKAAGKGSKTQAGILKGKFGYMSPEQVRGIPIDRRSDVFSCGIVLYELLTGERLFVGESDFSTLEKVRNVEILPPSTYNRRIPDELERIVLKALAKDPEDRYANAIDLHDELQAFVYTAGEFYSRKDLAGWMKKTFGREIEEESAKLESYRQLKPPAEVVAQPPRASGTRPPSASATNPIRKSTEALRSVGTTKPPPPPTLGRASGPIVSQQPSRMGDPLPDGRSGTVPSLGGAKAKKAGEDGLEWDDDELETQIYDNPDDAPKTSKKNAALPLASPPTTPTPGVAAAGSPPPAPPPVAPTKATGQGPDLSSLVSTAKSWGDLKPAGPPPPTNGANGSANPWAAPVMHAPPPPVAVPAREISAPQRLVSPPDQMFDPMASFGSGMLAAKRPKRNQNMLYIAVGGAVIAVIAVVVIISTTGGSGKKAATDTAANASGATAPAGSAAPAVAVATDPNTGFDLYVSPGGVTSWRLDGELRTDRLPSRIRGIAPGPHTVAIDAPPGFMSQNQPVTVEAGKSPKVEITLVPLTINGTFDTTPPGATVSLIIDGQKQALGASPQKSTLDPRKTYQVLFEKPGYVSVNRPIVFTGANEEKISVNLEKAGPGAAIAAAQPTPTPTPTPVVTPTPKVEKTGPVTRPDPVKTVEKKEPEKVVEKAPEPEKKAPVAAAGTGTLLLGSKPPCEIYIDGAATGQHTPQRDIKLSAGKHKVTLVNNDFSIKESFTVDIKADQTDKEIKDYSDRIPK